MTQYSGKVIRKTPVTPTQQSASGVWKLNEQAAAIRNNLWPVPGVPNPISRSVRLRSSASAYFNRTFGTPTSATRWTWSGWVKRGALGVNNPFFNPILAAGEGASFNTSNQLVVAVNGAFLLVSTPVYRDPSAWYHIVLASDMANATASLRFRVYVNGVEVTAWATDARASYTSFPYWCQNGVSQNIGYGNAFPAYFDGYLTEINFVDGQQLTPSSFGTTDPLSGAWEPMPYTGTYGANGFYLNFKDNTSTTTLGYDYSGNANNWTANNISLTAGSTYDSMLDVPTPWVGYNTGDTTAVTRGNYATFNPLTGGSSTTSDGNLAATIAPVNGARVSTIAVTSGKWYCEMVATTINGYFVMGIGASYSKGWDTTQESNPNSITWSSSGSGTYIQAKGSWTFSSNTVASNYTTNDVVGIALDLDSNTLAFYKNGVSQGSMTINTQGMPVAFLIGNSSGASNGAGYVNFGQRPFAYTPPSGYKTLCTTNLSTPTIANGANYMAASTYTGNGTSQTIVNSGNNTAALSFKPDFVWIKARSIANSNTLVNSVAGATAFLSSNSTSAEATNAQVVSAITSTGFSVGNDGNTNSNTNTYVAWQWQAGQGSTSSNTNGSITSTVSVNTTAGFSVVTYTGTGANATVGHGLGVAPSLIIFKTRNSADNWPVWHGSFAVNEYVYLNLTNAKASLSTFMNGTLPNSTVISLGTWANTNTNGTTMVAYCWAAVAGYSAFGSYTGNGSADGPFVYTGFRPRWVMIKCSSASATSWVILDTSRDTYNAETNGLLANLSDAESSGYLFDGLSNGFKVRNTGSGQNTNGATYIYAAFAENPFKYSNAR